MQWAVILLIPFGNYRGRFVSCFCTYLIASALNDVTAMYRVSPVFLCRHICGLLLLYKGRTTWQ